MSTGARSDSDGRDIREIAASNAGDDRFLTVDGSGQVSHWRALSREPVTTFATSWSFGGRRLPLGGDPHQPVALTAAWERHGVCAYDAGTGRTARAGTTTARAATSPARLPHGPGPHPA